MNPLLALKSAMTGAVIPTFAASAPTGWMLLNGSTIGNAASGATRANADTELLFTLLWDNLANAEAPVSGGRGGSAAADYAANKTLTLPDFRGRCIIGAGTGSGLTARTVGTKGGTETHPLDVNEIPAHRHFAVNTDIGVDASPDASATTSISRENSPGTDFKYQLDQSATEPTTGRTSETGGGAAHANMQPWGAMHFIIKL